MSFVAVAIGGMNAMNQIQQGRFANAQAGLQAQQSDYQAQVEQATALKTAEIIRRAGRRQVGQANAAYAASGVKVGEGSALETERQIDQDVEHDAFQTILDGDRRASGLHTQASFDRASGRSQQAASYVNAAGTLLATGYQAASKWKTMPSTGDGLSQGDRRKLGVY